MKEKERQVITKRLLLFTGLGLGLDNPTFQGDYWWIQYYPYCIIDYKKRNSTTLIDKLIEFPFLIGMLQTMIICLFF